MVDLCKMKLDKPGFIKTIDINDNMKRRFLDIGIIPNVRITRILEDYSKNMSAYLIMDSIIAIRNSDTKGVKVIYE